MVKDLWQNHAPAALLSVLCYTEIFVNPHDHLTPFMGSASGCQWLRPSTSLIPYISFWTAEAGL